MVVCTVLRLVSRVCADVFAYLVVCFLSLGVGLCIVSFYIVSLCCGCDLCLFCLICEV